MKSTSKWQLENIPLQINKVPVHFRIKRSKRPISRARSTSKETRKAAGTCISPRLYECDSSLTEFNYDHDLKENIGLFIDDKSIIEMPSHLEESPRKDYKCEKVLVCKNSSSCVKKKINLISETPKQKVSRSNSKIIHRKANTPKSKHFSIKAMKEYK